MSVYGSERLCSFKTEEEEWTPKSNDRTPTMTSSSSSPLSDSMISKASNDITVNDVITHEMPHNSQEESAILSEVYGTDLQRTLGEILAYCQKKDDTKEYRNEVTYGAVLKLEEKFDILQAKVANIQPLHQNPALLSQRTCMSSSYPESFQSMNDGLLTRDLSMPHLRPISSSPQLSVESGKPPTLSPGSEVSSPSRLDIQSQSPNTARTTTTHSSTQEPSFDMNQTRTSVESSDPAENICPANTCYVGHSEREVFLPNSVLQRAAKMARPSTAVRYLLRNIFTAEELSQSSTTGNPTRCLKRLDPNKISAIREWAVKRYRKFDLRERGKDWKVCLSVMNSTARYFRFMDKTRKQKMKSNGRVSSEAEASSAHTAEIDVELSDSDTEHKPQELLRSRINSVSDCDMPTESIYESNQTIKCVFLGPPHREVKVPEFALSAAHLRTRPELIARYLIKFIFSEDVLVRSNVYGARRGIEPLDYNKISALREHLSDRFPCMQLEEDGSDWKVCVGAINSSIRKFRYERKMGIKRGIRC